MNVRSKYKNNGPNIEWQLSNHPKYHKLWIQLQNNKPNLHFHQPTNQPNQPPHHAPLLGTKTKTPRHKGFAAFRHFRLPHAIVLAVGTQLYGPDVRGPEGCKGMEGLGLGEIHGTYRVTLEDETAGSPTAITHEKIDRNMIINQTSYRCWILAVKMWKRGVFWIS